MWQTLGHFVDVFRVSKELCGDVDVSDNLHMGALIIACVVGSDVGNNLIFVGWVGGKR